MPHMIYFILSKLFSKSEYGGEYIAKPAQLFYSLLFMSAGTVSWFYDGWVVFGTLTVILGFLLGLSIIICMNWEEVIKYWETINEHVKLMNKTSNPDLWRALGYSPSPETIQIVEHEDKGQGSFTRRITNVPVNPAQMNTIANKVLMTKSLDFSEEDYGKLIPNFRKFRQSWIKEGKLVQKNKKNPRLGYVLTKKGLQVMYEFASDYYLKLEKKND